LITSQSQRTQNGGVSSGKGGFSQKHTFFIQLHETHFGQYFLQSESLLQRASVISDNSASDFIIISACKYIIQQIKI